jgi:nitrous oxidase accessory protein
VHNRENSRLRDDMAASLLLLVIFSTCLGAIPLLAADLHVGPGQTHASLTSTVASAAAGDRILVHAGRYAEGNIRVTKPLQLIGLEKPVLDGSGVDEVLTIEASECGVSGFVLCHGGRSSTKDLAGIRVEAARHVTIENNEVRQCNFGIYLAKARDSRVTGNTIEGEPDRDQNCGNGIHLWNCDGIAIESNRITGHRDGIYLEFASHSTVEKNLVEQNLRYGLHFMFSHDSAYRQNRFTRNGAGVAVMYSHQVEMTANRFDHNWGSAAYGLLLKDISDSRISGNTFDQNSTAIYAQGANRVSFQRNEFLQNGWALRILTNGTHNVFEQNNFKGNSFDVGTNGQLSEHRFAQNYWDRYEGYDLNHDGIGDIPFRPASLYAMVVERVPASMLLSHCFMVYLLDRAERAFPSITPDSVVDASPARRPFALTSSASLISQGSP